MAWRLDSSPEAEKPTTAFWSLKSVVHEPRPGGVAAELIRGNFRSPPPANLLLRPIQLPDGLTELGADAQDSERRKLQEFPSGEAR